MIYYIVISTLGTIFLILMVFCCFSLIFSVLSFAPWVPSRRRDFPRIFRLAGLKAGQVFYDLGCGDGQVVAYAARNYRARAIGLEISLPFFLICRLRLLFKPDKLIRFKFKNLFKKNLADADVIYFFGIPGSLNEKFSAKLKRELKPGAKVISYAFKLHDWQPKIIDKPTPKDLSVYLYEA